MPPENLNRQQAKHYSSIFDACILKSLKGFLHIFQKEKALLLSSCCWIVFDRCLNNIVQSLCIFKIMLMRM